MDFELLFEALLRPPFSPVLKSPRPRTLGMFMFTGTLDGSHAWVDGCANGGRLQDRPVQTFTRVLRQCQRDDRSLAVVGQRPFLHLNERQPSIYQADIPDQRETSLYLHLFSITFYQSSFPCLSAALTVYSFFFADYLVVSMEIGNPGDPETNTHGSTFGSRRKDTTRRLHSGVVRHEPSGRSFDACLDISDFGPRNATVELQH